jgi:hypothetical protein
MATSKKKRKSGAAIKNRVVEIRTVKGRDLIPNPHNWRVHTTKQAEVMRALLADVGQVDVLRAIQTKDGLMLVDGHLRADVSPDAEWQVAVLDLSPEEAKLMLATFDPVGDMAEADPAKLDALLRDIQTGNEHVAKMLDDLAQESGIVPAETAAEAPSEAQLDAALQHKIIVDCRDEQHQAELLERFDAEGITCKALIV